MPVIIFLGIICVAAITYFVFDSMFKRIPYEVHRKMNENRSAIVTSAEHIIELIDAVPFESWGRTSAFPESLFAQGQTSLHAGLIEIEGKYYAARSKRDFDIINNHIADLHERVIDSI